MDGHEDIALFNADVFSLVNRLLPLLARRVLSCVSKNMNLLVWKNVHALSFEEMPANFGVYVSKAPHLRELHLGNISELLFVAGPLRTLTMLRSLSLTGATDNWLNMMLSTGPGPRDGPKPDTPLIGLKHLALRAPRITSQGVSLISVELKNLEVLELLDCPKILPKVFHDFHMLTQLKELIAEGSRISRLQAIAKLTALEKLYLPNCMSLLLDSLQQDLTSLVNLKALSLKNAGPLTDDRCGTICNMTGLTDLDIADNLGSDNELSNFSCLTNLKVLRVINAGDQFAEAISRTLTRLEHLQVAFNSMSQTGIYYLQALVNLKTFELDPQSMFGLESMTAGFVHLPTSITELSFTSVRGSQYISHLTNLNKLTIFHGRTGPFSDFEALADLTRLEELTIGGPYEEDWMVHLQRLTGLEHLNLNGCLGTDGSKLAHLSRMTRLKVLYLDAFQPRGGWRDFLLLVPLTRLECLSLHDLHKELLPHLISLRKLCSGSSDSISREPLLI